MQPPSTLPALPAAPTEFLSYIDKQSSKSTVDLLKPYRDYDARIRELYAQEPESVEDPYANVVSVFDGPALKTRARTLDAESTKEKDSYVMPISDEHRRADGSPATVESLKEFKHNFSVFTEMALADLDWNNVVVAGSAALTPLLPVPEKYNESKRALRQYYHEELAPASDVDLFLYDLTEEQAKDKIKQIEAKVRDSILQEVTCIRTKNAITIASQYPIRHIQIVIRIYKSISQILSGFDVDCSCVAFDGERVWAAPRGLQAMMTQVNHIDLSRRSPSYENRLSKYSHRGFEVCWPALDRSRVDPTIFERSFMRTVGLARLLVLEKLPGSKDRDNYANIRRKERGRPELNLRRRNMHKLKGNIKNDYEDEVADWWVDEEEVSDYHTFSLPYGLRFNAKKIEKLLYTKDLLLNAEWNRNKERDVNLHRHPAFFGFVEDVFGDCCQNCPKPVTDEEFETAEQEDKIYVKGEISFIKDNPGRQQIGSFNPITDSDWTEMAYVGNTARLCVAIVDGDLENVQDWLAHEDADPNQRDHCGRTPLQLAVQASTPAVVRALVEADARLIARTANGYTALHMAAQRGDAEMIKIILERSERNEAEHEEKEMTKKDERKRARNAESTQDISKEAASAEDRESQQPSGLEVDEKIDDEDWNSDDDSTSMATESFVKVKKEAEKVEAAPEDENSDDPDFYDLNVLAWDQACSPLHLAILGGHTKAVKLLVDTFGADVLLPVKLLNDYDKSPRAAILTLVLALALPQHTARDMTKTLLDLHASSSQADLKGISALHYYANDGADALDFLLEHDKPASIAALQHLAVSGNTWRPETNSALLTAISKSDPITCFKILENGVAPDISFSSWIRQARTIFDHGSGFHRGIDPDFTNKLFQKSVEQPLVVAVNNDVTEVAVALLAAGADANTLTKASAKLLGDAYAYNKAQSVLDVVRAKLEKLKQYDGEKSEDEPPMPMKVDEEYLNDLQPGTYKHWVASTSLLYARERYVKELEDYERRVEAFASQKGLEEKRDAVRMALNGYGKLETELLQRGAKTFEELHPDIKDSGNGRHRSYQPYKAYKKPFEVSFSFQVGELNEDLKLSYLELFEAVWAGDLDTIKSLTLAPQGKNKDQSPLQIAVQDFDGASPFSVAVMRGHLDLANAILEICFAQYSPKEKDENARYTMTLLEDDGEYSDSDMGSNEEDDVQVFKQLVDDRFTIDNIGEVSMKVDSHVTPLDFLGWACPAKRFVDGHVAKKVSSASSLLGYAIDADDHDLLVWLLDIGRHYSTAKNEHGASSAGTFYSVGSGYLQQAVKLGRTRMIAELLKRTGCGIPFEDLVKKSGVTLKEKLKWYQGLSVYGKKRADWAAAGRRMQVQTMSGSQISPLLMAAKLGNLESLEYLLSDTPLRLYLEFAAANKDDKRVKRLTQAAGGAEKSISDWYLANEECLITCVVVAKPDQDADRRLEYLIKAYPNYMEAKSTLGETPLQLAFKLGRRSAAKILLEAGANPMTRDKAANNLIHKLLEHFTLSNDAHKIPDLKAMLDLLGEEIRRTLILQRNASSSGGGSPFHNWLNARMYTFSEDNGRDRVFETIELLLSFSKGDELITINGAGDSPLHSIIAGRKLGITRQLLTHNPELLYRENATGRTPFELARDLYTALKLKNPPTVGTSDSTYYGYRYGNSEVRTISDNAPDTFVKDDKPKDKRSVEEKIWDLCREVAAEHPGKRRLVSLNEANEVARRLGDMAAADKRGGKKMRLRYRPNGQDEEQDGKGVNVVVSWLNDGQAWIKSE